MCISKQKDWRVTDGSFHEKFSREKNDVTLNYYLGMLGGVTSYDIWWCRCADAYEFMRTGP